jgi:hypothetical protein
MPGGADSISVKKVDANHYEATLKKAGKEVGTSKLEISKDGKAATLTSKGVAADGKPQHAVSGYDKQQLRAVTCRSHICFERFRPVFLLHATVAYRDTNIDSCPARRLRFHIQMSADQPQPFAHAD